MAIVKPPELMLFTPGPVAVLPQVNEAQTWAMINHRGKAFQSIYGPIREDLKRLMNCAEAHVMTGSGTLGVEANVQNALPDGGKVLVLSNGAFGDKLHEHAKLYYPGSLFVRLKDAQGWNLARAKEHIDKAASEGVGLLAIVHHETSPGILNDIAAICPYAKSKGMLTLVDGTSAWPAYPYDQTAMGVDFYSFASQKALGMPPGIAVVGLSADGAKAVEAAPRRTNFMNLKEYRKMAAKNENPTTPAVSLLYSLEAALELVQKEGMAKFISRHQQMAAHIRARLTQMGFKLVCEPGFESNTVTAFFVQKNSDVSRALESKYKVKLGGGHADWKETSLRFCNMGDVNMEKVEKGLKALEAVKKEMGV